MPDTSDGHQDPTGLTRRALDALDELIKERERALQALLESKMNNIEAVSQEKFEGIKTQLANSETALRNAFQGNKDLIDAQNRCFSDAAKKSEEALKEQITAVNTLMSSTFSGHAKNIDELKTMVISGLSSDKGATAAQARMMAGVSLAITMAGFLFLVASHAWSPSSQGAPPASANLQVVPK